METVHANAGGGKPSTKQGGYVSKSYRGTRATWN